MGNDRSVAIVGAGVSGLAAACLLSRNGVQVHLFEAGAKVGGCCATSRIGGYTFNDGALYLAMPGLLERLLARLGLDPGTALPLRRIVALQSTVLPDGTRIEVGEGPELSILPHPGAKASYRNRAELAAFLAAWGPMLDDFAEDLLPHPFSMGRFLARGWRHLPRLMGTAAAGLERHFSSRAVQGALGGSLLYAGVPPDRMPATALLGLASMLRDGLHIPEGGMGRLPEALAEKVRETGGHIHLQTPVRKLLVEDGRVRGLEVPDGPVEADAVISTLSGMHTCETLLPASAVPPRLRRRVNRAPLSHRGFVLQLGLPDPVEARSHIHAVLPWLRDQGEIFRGASRPTPWVTWSVPTVTLPELAPQGGSIVEIFPSIPQDLAPDQWDEARKEGVARAALEAVSGESSPKVAVRRILSPREFRDDLHLFAGALYGLSPAAGPGALFPCRTPIRGLFQAGQTTWPGFGVVSAGWSGVFAAEAILEEGL
ncbi:MAG: NAD(P)/FAD-dependent oxidoreductase [Acidobacteria bacterium]|nr:NAD(P)/FAD-dependent oxidoreductase [Acidobacteriota bacterium]